MRDPEGPEKRSLSVSAEQAPGAYRNGVNRVLRAKSCSWARLHELAVSRVLKFRMRHPTPASLVAMFACWLTVTGIQTEG